MSVRIPKYRRHSTGKAFVEVDGKRFYLGEHGSKPSKEAYRRIVAELCSGQTISALAQPIDSVTIGEPRPGLHQASCRRPLTKERRAHKRGQAHSRCGPSDVWVIRQ